ncbi:YjjG family noncanonical pyrimidine nucleotidase [Ilumatobacter nonamiensis]|uniref:YjjG family noncanonical pyrimidine nucleotidase n=1 Tax=Ilumatobacter nonamiensis TaxID=467093 RepID=UPI0003476574|nr:YjjG family noncanonical pyrimidine nucleotidase [Ilumatobacter nonamiensis]
MRYSTVLFDLDHTLFDTHASEAAAFDATMRSADLDSSSEILATYDRINQALWRRVEGGEFSPNDIKVRRFEEFLAEVGADGDPVAMAEAFVAGLAENGELYSDSLATLEALSPACRLALITNGLGSVQRGRLRRLGLEERFEAVSISGELGMSKPGREIFDHTLTELGVDDRSGVVMVGDSLASDIRGGSNAGIQTVWFNPNGLPNTTDVEPTHEVRGLDELFSVVG